MSELQIAWLELGTVGGLGAILVLIGIMIGALTKKRNSSCTDVTKGIVIKYGFPGEGRMYPIVEYTVDGKHYCAKKTFRGIKLKKISGLPMNIQSEAYEDEKGWLHVKIGPIANLHQLAEQIWPINSAMTVYYNPDNPKKSYVERPVSSSFTSIMFIVMGFVAIAISVLIFFLMQL